MSAENDYVVELEDGLEAHVHVSHGLGADNTWAHGLLFDDDANVVAETDSRRYLCYDDDQEIVDAVVARLMNWEYAGLH